MWFLLDLFDYEKNNIISAHLVSYNVQSSLFIASRSFGNKRGTTYFPEEENQVRKREAPYIEQTSDTSP